MPVPQPANADSPLCEEAKDHLSSFEGIVQTDNWRTRNLRYLHEETVQQFVKSPGFGVMREIRGPTESGLKPSPRDASPPQTIGTPIEVDRAESASAAYDASLFGLHQNSMLDFVNPTGFGFVRDRRHVAGFQSHAFSRFPETAKRWKVESIELIGLLVHPEPVVYKSSHLPAMDELRRSSTRALDEFETEAMTAIRRGDELVPGVRGDHFRMVGGIRSARQCVDCHGGQRGDLLGAFSYTLRRVKTKP